MKSIDFKRFRVEFLMDISNLFNTRRLWNTGDQDYRTSLHLPASEDYDNIVSIEGYFVSGFASDLGGLDIPGAEVDTYIVRLTRWSIWYSKALAVNSTLEIIHKLGKEHDSCQESCSFFNT